MPLILVDQDATQGHCWGPAPITAAKQSEQTPGSVKIDNKLIVLVGDGGMHSTGCGDRSPHRATSIAGSPTVFVNGISVVRDGDPMDCGDVADTQGSNNVFANGGGNISVAFPTGIPAGEDPDETVGYVVEGPDALRLTYPAISLPGRINVNLITNKPTESWRYWRPSALQPKNSNPFEIVLTEEKIAGSRRQFISTQGVGASLPPAAPEVFQQPLDPFVTFQVVKGPFSVTNSGTLTLNPNFVPSIEDGKFERSIEVSVKMIYGQAGIVEKTFTFTVALDLSTPA